MHSRFTPPELDAFFFSQHIITSAAPRSAPSGPLDFHTGDAELKIGNLKYSPAVHSILRYEGVDFLRVDPSFDHRPGKISGIFCDENGQEVLRLENNEWIESLAAWDIKVQGKRLIVRQRKGHITLRLRLDPPGRLVIERLDMRLYDCHILATEKTYVVGRYISRSDLQWLHADVVITKSTPLGAAIEFAQPSEIERRHEMLRGSGQQLATADNQIVCNSNLGVTCKPFGIILASMCGGFHLSKFATGPRSLADMRKVYRMHPQKVCQFIGSGTI